MKRTYEDTAYDTAIWPGSFWRETVADPVRWPVLDTEAKTEVAIIGGGFTGLNAALELAERGVATVLLDAGQPGWGASGRNGGFACMGGAKLSGAVLRRRFGTDAAMQFHHFQRDAVVRVADNLAVYDIAADSHSDGELCLAHRASVWPHLQKDADTAEALYGLHYQRYQPAELAGAGLGGGGFHGGIRNPVGFALNPMKYVTGLAQAAHRAGAQAFGDSAALGIERDGGGWRVRTAAGAVHADRIIVATNGYCDDDMPPGLGKRLIPVLSSILVTRPITPAEQEAQGWRSDLMAYDTRRLLHYFRLMPDGRMLFGMRGGLSARPSSLARVQRAARADFEAMFPAWRHVETPFFWSGLACLTSGLRPYVGPLPDMPGVFAAAGYHGNGVSTGSQAGRLVGQIAAGIDADVPAVMARPLPPLLLPGLRRHMLGVAYAGYAIADRFG